MGLDLVETALLVAATAAAGAGIAGAAMHWRGASSEPAATMLKAGIALSAVALVIAVLLYAWVRSRTA